MSAAVYMNVRLSFTGSIQVNYNINFLEPSNTPHSGEEMCVCVL